jgi:hypothetical protein
MKIVLTREVYEVIRGLSAFMLNGQNNPGRLYVKQEIIKQHQT